MSEAPVRQRPGPKPRFTQDDVVDAALAVVEVDGFAALSLRSVARELGITSMAMYTYVASREALCLLVVDRLIAERVAGFVWPAAWPEALHAFADSVSELIDEHPAIVEAFAEGNMRTAVAMSAAETMLQRLLDGGLPIQVAGTAYAAMHALVLGHALLRQGAAGGVEGAASWEVDAGATPALDAYSKEHGRLIDVSLRDMIDLLIAGIEHRATEG